MTNQYYANIHYVCAHYYEMLLKFIDDNDYYGWSDIAHPNRSQAFDTLIFLKDVQREAIKKEMPLNKLNRWLGFIQGTIISYGLTTIEKERNFTRPFFRPLDYPEKLDEV